MADQSTCIMIIEDEALIALDLADGLEQDGYEVMGPYFDADAALRDLRRRRPHAAIVDIKLRSGDSGLKVCDALIERGIPFVFSSGYSFADDREAKKYGRFARLPKPCSHKQVLSAVSKLVAPASRPAARASG